VLEAAAIILLKSLSRCIHKTAVVELKVIFIRVSLKMGFWNQWCRILSSNCL